MEDFGLVFKSFGELLKCLGYFKRSGWITEDCELFLSALVLKTLSNFKRFGWITEEFGLFSNAFGQITRLSAIFKRFGCIIEDFGYFLNALGGLLKTFGYF